MNISPLTLGLSEGRGEGGVSPDEIGTTERNEGKARARDGKRPERM